MKEGMKYAILRKLRWLSLVAIMLIGVQTEVLGGRSDYYYTPTATVNANGKVYITNTRNPEPNTNQYVTSFSYPDSPISNGDNNTVTLYLWALPDPGYQLDRWVKGNSTISSNPPANPTQRTETISNRGSSNAAQLSYTAYFVKKVGVVTAESENVSKGTASYTPNNNKIGESVTLSATPLGGRLFLGWTKDNGTSYVSTANPYSFTINANNMGTYIAHFSDVTKGYIRLQNKSTEKFVSYYGNGSPTGTLESGLAFNGSLQMIEASKAQGNPETVFLKTAHQSSSGSLGFDLMAHDVSYSTLVDAQHLLNMEEVSAGVYRIYANVGSQKSYLCDNGSLSMSIMSTPDASAEWYVYDLSGSSAEGAFGANTKAKYTDGEGKYYTTMFADFAYQCGEGVKAYYLPATEESYDAEEKRVYFTEISSGKVPANTAVVLECNAVQNDFSSTKTVVNILKPILPDAAPNQIVSESGNLLKGYVSVNGNTVDNDMDKMYVLSYDNHLGFYHSTSSTMSPNKAYLNVGTIPEQNNIDVTAVRYSFGRSGIDNPDNPDNPDDPTPTDLKGDMNNDGQITITDVMLLLKMVSEE